MYHFKHVVMPNIYEASPKTAEILPPCGRQNDTYINLLLSSHHPCRPSSPCWHTL